MITDVLSLVLILSGAFFAVAAAVGVARFPSTLARIHAITKPQTTGLILTIVGALIRIIGHDSFSVAHRGDLGILVLLVVFAGMTSPVTAQRVGRLARKDSATESGIAK